MALSLQVPIHVSPDAEAHVEWLGLRRELDLMIEHTRGAVLGVRSVSVRLAYSPEGGEPMVLILAETKVPGTEGPESDDYRSQLRWDEWVVDTFSPDVHRYFCMLTTYGVGDDGR